MSKKRAVLLPVVNCIEWRWACNRHTFCCCWKYYTTELRIKLIASRNEAFSVNLERFNFLEVLGVCHLSVCSVLNVQNNPIINLQSRLLIKLRFAVLLTYKKQSMYRFNGLSTSQIFHSVRRFNQVVVRSNKPEHL